MHKLGEPLPDDVEAPFNAELKVDSERRRNIEAHHTATHLFHWALHEHVGEEATQKGSLVAENRLRFDFNSRPLSQEQIEQIENSVNHAILRNHPVTWQEFPYAEVSECKVVKQLFGEKYGEMVRVVQIGGKAGALDGFSMELCGGTHVRATGELGIFKVVSEGAISAGIRRIEAVTGIHGITHLLNALDAEKERAEELQQKLLDANKALEKERAAAAQREAGAVVAKLIKEGSRSATIPHFVHNFGAANKGVLDAALNACKANQFTGAAVFFVQEGGKVQFGAYVSSEYQGKLPANELVQAIAPLIGGKGGGKPALARGAGTDATQLPEAVSKIRTMLSF